MKYAVIIGFVIMVAAQWYAPISMILDSEKTIDDGKEYRFRTRPVDPSDPFRGKYIVLYFEGENYVASDTNELKLDQYSTAYATLGTDSSGYARIDKLLADPPVGNSNYVEVQFQYAYDNNASLRFPFNEFFLEESKASEAEQVYWRSRGDSTMDCYAKVKVLKGDAKLVDVIVNDSSIVDVVRRINANKPD